MEMDVLGTTRYVVERSRSVRTDREAIERWAATVNPDAIRRSTQPHDVVPDGTIEQIANFVLLVDALNFGFWTEPEDATPWVVTYRGREWRRYFALLAALSRAVDEDAHWFEASRWADATRGELAHLFRGEGEIPMLDERVAAANETGRGLAMRFDGQALHLLDAAGRDAAALARELARAFPSFADRAAYDGRTVWLLKRAQICAADMAAAMEATGGPQIAGLDHLTAFADYRLPQILRHLGILGVADPLAERIERRETIAAGSPEEVELRAHTIWGVEWMRQALAARGEPKDTWLIDEYLWERSHDADVRIEHHRTRTIAY